MPSERAKTLLACLPNHPSSAAMRQVVLDSFAVADRFAARRAQINGDGSFTPSGKMQATLDALTNTFAAELAKARRPIAKVKDNIRIARDAMKLPAPDPTNVLAGMQAMEIRSAIAAMGEPKATQLLLMTKDIRLLDAVLQAPAMLSNISPRLYDDVADARRAQLFAAEMEEVATMEEVVAAAEAAAQVARNDMRSIADIEGPAFDRLLEPSEEKAKIIPWLKQSDDKVLVMEVDPKTGRPTREGGNPVRPASAEDIAVGSYFANFEEYQRAHTEGAAAV